MDTLRNVVNTLAVFVIPLIIIGFPLYGLFKRVPVYEEFVTGAKDGFQTAVNIIPYLVAILFAIAMFRASLPDVQNTILEVIDAGDRVVIRWAGGGTHTGEPLVGIPAAGKPVQAHGVYILRFAGGRIAEVWNHWDNLNVVQQLGGM